MITEIASLVEPNSIAFAGHATVLSGPYDLDRARQAQPELKQEMAENGYLDGLGRIPLRDSNGLRFGCIVAATSSLTEAGSEAD